jgi:hypothetical protein
MEFMQNITMEKYFQRIRIKLDNNHRIDNIN